MKTDSTVPPVPLTEAELELIDVVIDMYIDTLGKLALSPEHEAADRHVFASWVHVYKAILLKVRQARSAALQGQ